MVTVAALVLTLYVTRHTLPQVCPCSANLLQGKVAASPVSPAWVWQTSNKQQLLNDSPMQEAAKAAVSLQRLEGEWIKVCPAIVQPSSCHARQALVTSRFIQSGSKP